jgi:diguanylate cyclase (GGDEF)-like protein/PAS domain S-box-containing protein
MRIRSQLLAFVGASLVTGVFAAVVVFAAGRREDAAADSQARAQVAEHEVAGLLALTQEYARYAEPRAAEQWHLRLAAIESALDGDTHPLPGAALVELRNVTHALPPLFTRLEELPAGDDPFTLRRKEALLDQLLTNTQAMSDYAYQWFQDAVVVRSEAEREFKWIAFSAPFVMLAMLLASALVVRQRVLVPMRRLDQAAAAIRRGDLSFRLASAAQDEFGDLAREFDAMTAALVESDRLRDRSEQQLRDMTDNLPALVAYIDPEHQYRFANEKFRDWLGHDPYSVVGRHVAEVMGEAVYETVKPHLDRALRGERVQWSRTLRREGRERHLLVEYIPHVDAQGTVRGAYALTIDITERREAELRMARSEQRMVDLTNAIPAMVGYFDMDQVCLYANDAGLRTLGVERASVPGITMRAALGEATYAQHEPCVREVLQGRRARLQGKIPFEGREAHFQAHLIPDRLAGGAQRGFYLMTFDVTALKEAEARRAKVERQLRAITDNLPVSITYIDPEERYRFVNRTGLEWLGKEPAEVLGGRLAEVLPREAYDRRRDALRRALQGERVSFETATAGDAPRDLSYVYLPDIQSDGTVAGVYGLGNDVSALKKVERQLGLLVRSDVLTGLANRYQFNEALPLALARARRSGSAIALMYLDIDRFKAINDSLGHAAGDEVLKAFAVRIVQSVRTTDTVARLGGDEFVIVLEGLHGEDEPQFVARKIIANVARPLEIGGHPLPLTTSIGVAYRARVQAADDAAAEALIACADKALYAAKNAGRNTCRVLVDTFAQAEAAAS